MTPNTITIGDAAEIVSKGTTPTSLGLSYASSGIPFLRGEDVLSSAVDLNSVRMFLDRRAHAVLSRSALKQGDVLITIAGTIGRIGFIDEAAEANCNQAVAFVRLPKERFDSHWVCLLLSSPVYQSLFSGFIVGGAIQNVSLEQISSIEIPNIRLEDQRRIAARLKAHLAEVETARQAVECQLSELDKLSNATIRQSMEEKGNSSARLGDVLVEVKAGIGKSWSKYPVLGATREGLAPAKEPVGMSPERYKPVSHGTVFYNPMRILIGSIAFVEDDDEVGVTSPDYVVLRGKENIVDSRWFYYWLRSPYGEQCINSLARGAVRERMLFNRLAEGAIDLPSYPTQVKASKALKELKRLKHSMEKQLKEIKAMPTRLLSQAFET
jgi:type I restriction enzyme, S subunit